MKRDGEFNHAKVGPKMSTSLRDILDEEFSNFLCQLFKLTCGQPV